MSVSTERRVTVEPVLTTAAPGPARVNLLPPEIAEAARLRRVQTGLAAGLVGVVGVVAYLHVAASGSVEDARVRLDELTARAATVQTQTTQYAGVELVYARTASAQQLLQQAMGQEVRYSSLLAALSQAMPDKVWLTEVSVTQPAATPGAPLGTVTFTGAGTSHDDVAAWLDALAEHDELADAAFSSSTAVSAGGRRTVTFTSTATLTAAALSERHTVEAG